MPAFTEQMLSDEQVDAIVDYVNALQETPGPL
jgi:mono/diheme cytochrome c family protein